jgi:uncharacterized DUF497 family protein
MRIAWDEPKRLANIDSHEGLDFADLTIDFFESAKVIPAKGGRHIAVGRLDGSVLVVVFQVLGGEAVSVISMRRANRKERKLLDG